MIRRSGLAIAGTAMTAIVGLAAWAGASAETWAGVSFLTTGGVLILAAIGAVCRGRRERPRFLGFAVFGWGYFALARWYSFHQGPMPTVCWLLGAGDIHNDLLSLPPHVRIVHDAWSLAFGVVGSILAAYLHAKYSAWQHERPEELSGSGTLADWWRGAAFAGLAGVALVAVAAVLAGRRREPESWAGAAFLLTWALFGLAVLGAICSRGRQRKAWIGAASFGIGYLMVAFSSAVPLTLPTDHLLNAVFRPAGPTAGQERSGDDFANNAESEQVRRALREPITLNFSDHASLKILLEHIKNAIRRPLGNDLVIYAGTVNWYHARELDNAVVAIDKSIIPAEDALRICLGQIGLRYRIQSGYVRIVPDAYQPLPFAEDPVMIAGHSLLALFAASFGGVSAAFVASLRRP